MVNNYSFVADFQQNALLKLQCLKNFLEKHVSWHPHHTPSLEHWLITVKVHRQLFHLYFQCKSYYNVMFYLDKGLFSKEAEALRR